MAEQNQDEVLFTITRKHLNTGLRGFPVGTVWTSKVDPQKGVSYVGYHITELAKQDPEKVVYLLLYKKWPTDEEADKFKQELKDRAQKFPRKVIDLLKNLPKEGHPMEWFISGLVFLGMLGKKNDYMEDGLNLIAWTNELVAAIFRIREGWGDPIPPDPNLDYVDNFVHMLDVPGADKNLLLRVLKNHYILHFDHGGGNLSTFTGKAVASGLADIFAAMAAAMAGLYGPRHGRANQDCLNFVRRVGNPDENYIRNFVEDLLAKKELIYGFGHAVLRQEDPRAKIEYELAEELFPDDELVKIALAMRKVIPPILAATGKIADPYPNVDAVSGVLLHAAGLKNSDYYTVLFGWSRVVGITAQIIDERLHFRDGRGVPIYRCKYLPENQPERSLNE